MLRINTTFIALKGKPGPILRAAGASNKTVSLIISGKAQNIRLALLTNLCLTLNCTPNDLLTYTQPPKTKLPEGHALTQLLPTQQVNILAALPTLTTTQIQQIQQIIQSS